MQKRLNLLGVRSYLFIVKLMSFHENLIFILKGSVRILSITMQRNYQFTTNKPRYVIINDHNYEIINYKTTSYQILK